MRAVALAVLLAMALAGCDTETPVVPTTSTPTAEPSAAAPQVVDPTATLGSWLFSHGTTGDDDIDELGNFTITITETGVEGGSICGRFTSTGADAAIYPLEPVWQPDATGPTSLCQPGPLAILSNFGALSPVSLENDTLTLTDATVTMSFTRIDTPSPVVSNWVLTSAKDAKGKLPLATSAQQLDLRLDYKNHYVIFSGCNTGTGQWRGGAGGFTLGTTSATLAGCDKKLAKLDTRYRAALAKVNTASVTNGVLRLTGPKVTLKLVAATSAGQ